MGHPGPGRGACAHWGVSLGVRHAWRGNTPRGTGNLPRPRCAALRLAAGRALSPCGANLRHTDGPSPSHRTPQETSSGASFLPCNLTLR